MGYVRTLGQLIDSKRIFLVDAEIHSEGTAASRFGPQRRYATARIRHSDGSETPATASDEPRAYYADVTQYEDFMLARLYIEANAAEFARRNEEKATRSAEEFQRKMHELYARREAHYKVTIPFTNHMLFPPVRSEYTNTVLASSAAAAYAKVVQKVDDLDAATHDGDMTQATIVIDEAAGE